jgi:hypothetical protein
MESPSAAPMPIAAPDAKRRDRARRYRDHETEQSAFGKQQKQRFDDHA